MTLFYREDHVAKRATGRSSMQRLWRRGVTFTGTATCVCAGLAGVCLSAATIARAETFNSAIDRQLGNGCAVFRQGSDEDPVPGVGPNLNALCAAGAGQGAGTSAGTGSLSAGTPALVFRERLRAVREGTDEEGGGASADTLTDLGQGFSLFLSAGASSVSHQNNEFEDGYASQVPTVTLGADYRLTDWLVLGLGFNYTNFEGDYDDGGGFNDHSFGPLLYASFTPWETSFVDVVLGYARQEYYSSRRASFFNGADTFGGHVSGNRDGNQYSGGVLAGYDYPIGNVTVGPRVGLNVVHWQNDSFEEDGNTGLEMRYSSLNRTSVQSSLGLTGTVAISTGFGVIVPQASAAWVHEYADDQRNMDARFVEDNRPNPSRFSFNRERPARNWADLDLGVSAVLPNGWQPFVNFSTIQGNDNFTTYGGAVGVRVGL